MHGLGARRIGRAAIAAATAMPLLVAVPSLAASGTHGHGAFINHTPVRGTQVHSLVVDSDGGRHWYTSGNAYYSLFPGEHTARRVAIKASKSFVGKQGQPPHRPPVMRAIVPTLSGRSIDIVTSNCKAMQTVKIGIHARTLPKITPADNVSRPLCGYPGFHAVDGAVALPHGRLAILMANDPRAAQQTGSVVFVGRPGHGFKAQRLAANNTSGDFGAAIARDPVDGMLYVTEAQNDGSGTLQVWTASSNGKVEFGAPTTVAPMPPGYVTTIAASHGYVWIGVNVPAGPNAGVMLTSRDPAGDWSPLTKVPGTTDTNRAIYLTPDTAAAAAGVWELDGLGAMDSASVGAGMEYRHLVGSSIGPPTVYSTRRHDYPETLAARPGGGVAIGHALSSSFVVQAVRS